VAGDVPAGFARRFRAAFGRAPGAEARLGYRAMDGVLRAVSRAGARGNDRTRVLHAYLSLPAGPPG